MNIYFAASIWGSPVDEGICTALIIHLRRHGRVLSEKLFEPSYKATEHLDMRAIHDRDIGWLRAADAIVAEVSSPSLGVGYEIREGVIQHIPVLCLYRPQEGKLLSAMIAGSPDIGIATYTSLNEAIQATDCFFRGLRNA